MAEKKKTTGCGCDSSEGLKGMVDKVWPKAKKELEDVVNKVWPKTKKELEKALDNTKDMLSKGEKYLKEFSDKSVKNTKKLSLNLMKEKVYHSLGKTLANTPKTNWIEDKKINNFVEEIKKLNREISKIK